MTAALVELRRVVDALVPVLEAPDREQALRLLPALYLETERARDVIDEHQLQRPAPRTVSEPTGRRGDAQRARAREISSRIRRSIAQVLADIAAPGPGPIDAHRRASAALVADVLRNATGDVERTPVERLLLAQPTYRTDSLRRAYDECDIRQHDARVGDLAPEQRTALAEHVERWADHLTSPTIPTTDQEAPLR